MSNINNLAEAYYNGTPIISDEEYDNLEGAEGQIGYTSSSNTIPHIKYMPSINKHKDFSLRDAGVMLAEYKYDGLSIELVYTQMEHKDLYIISRAVTRGDGFSGMDVTKNILTLLPLDALTLPLKLTSFMKGLPIGIYCEAVMNTKRLYQNGTKYDNLRNTVAGAISAKEPKEVLKYIDLVPFDLNDIYTQEEATTLLSELFLTLTGTPYKAVYVDLKIANLERLYKEMLEQKEMLPYPTDGIILKKADRLLRTHIKGKNPEWEFAIKWPDNKYDTEIVNVTYGVGKSGRIAPLGEVRPVISDSGAVIKFVTLHNVSWIKEQKIGIGSKVTLVRAGDIIPKIDQIINNGTLTIPINCPYCGQHLVTEGRDLMCTNSRCIGRLESTLNHFFGSQGLNIIGIGEKTINEYLNHYSQNDYPTLQTIISRMITNRLKALTSYIETNQVTIDKLIVALGIEGIGKQSIDNASKELLTATSNEDAIKKLVLSLTHIQAISLLKWYREHREDYLYLCEVFNATSMIKHTEDQVLSGMSIVFTGICSKTRQEMELEARILGAKPLISVTKDTSYVVAGNTAGRVKIENAMRKGVRILSEEEYRQLIYELASNNNH